MEYLKKIDLQSEKTKLAITIIVPLVLIFVLSPGVVFEINPSDPDQKVRKTHKITYLTSFIHSIIITVLLGLFYYFYLLKTKKTNGFLRDSKTFSA